MPTTIMWFRRDLRLSDNPALVEAVHAAGRDGKVVAAFCLDSRLRRPAGRPRLAYLSRCLEALHASIGGALVVRSGDPANAIVRLAAEVEADEIYCAADFGPYGSTRDEAVAAALEACGKQLVQIGSPYAVAPGTVKTAAGEPYKVFTPFSRAWRQVGWPLPVRAPAGVTWALDIRSNGVPAGPDPSARLPDAGEAAAKRAARQFWDHDLDDYDRSRDDPGADRTSRLSPHLKYGTIHPRQLLARLDSDTKAHRTYRQELCWREFYADVLHHRPESAHRALDESMSKIEVDTGSGTDERFRAWAEGRTGFPIVDAGMRQLLAEAWMHNRVRMITASFLVKDLHLDWTRGAKHFMQHLVDGDLASNQHGWQWTAGTGTDAAPYFRVFNPVRQGEQFDPRGDYVRRWVPELADVPDKYVHKPWASPAGIPPGYPPPMVDHAEEREEALRRYQARRR